MEEKNKKHYGNGRKKPGRKKQFTKAEATKRLNGVHDRCHKEKMIAVTVRFSKAKDSEIIARLGLVPNKTEYLRSLIAEDIKKTYLE